MARDEAYQRAEKKIEEARRTGAVKLNLSGLGSDLRLTELPESLGSLAQLQSLNLTRNQLTALPDWLGALTQLRELDLRANQLTVLPESLGALINLQALHLSSNRLITLPKWLGQLKQLQSLRLSNNQVMTLSEWPDALRVFTHLQLLSLSRNQLTALPDWLGALTQLRELDLRVNQLTALPESLGALINLQALHLSSNRLTTLPESLGTLTQLQILNIPSNQLTALPKSFVTLTQLQSLNLASNQLTMLPESLGALTQLRTLDLSNNQLTTLPESVSGLAQLLSLDLVNNQLTTLPESVGALTQLQTLNVSNNGLTMLPESSGALTQLQTLDLSNNRLTTLPESSGQLIQLQWLELSDNQLITLPESLSQLTKLRSLDLFGNQFPALPKVLGQLTQFQELAAAYKEGLDTVNRYLRSNDKVQVALNEAKLILIGEGEVGKSCLLGALRGDPWEEGRPTTHGIEIKPVKVPYPRTGTEITLNGWDFGGQRVYRPTHQLFFSAPAVYLVVWKPREGPQQGFVKEWIKLVKHREPDAKILVVATHGGPQERQPDIDRQEIWDLFGKDMVIDFFHVDSKPDEHGLRHGIDQLRTAIAHVAASLPEVGRMVLKRWQQVRKSLLAASKAYIPLNQVLAMCRERQMDEEEARLFVSISHRLGHLIHYEHDPALRDIVILKPDWLATAISFVLDDKQTRAMHGLVSMARLSQLWNDPERAEEFRYPIDLHLVFVRLMERFDLSYRVAGMRDDGESNTTNLIAQLSARRSS